MGARVAAAAKRARSPIILLLFSFIDKNKGLFYDATFMKRDFAAFLHRWLRSRSRMPLVIRGARQVGKTWLVRDFAEREGRVLLEINLERDPRLARSFACRIPAASSMTSP